MNKNGWVLAGFILLKFLLQYLLIHPLYELHRDEYLYLDQAHHLAWGYLSVPPVTSWISSLIYRLGNSIFWIRFFPALFGALTISVVWKTIEELRGGLYALVLGATCVLLSALLRLNTLYHPNSLDVLCWTLLYFVLIKYFKDEKPRWLYVAAFVFALGFLNKYNIVFLVVSLFPAVLMTGQRRVFLKKELYLAFLLGLLLISPNLLWQYNNGFPVVRHLTELSETQLVNVERLGFLKSQLLFFMGALPVLIAGLFGLVFFKPFRKYRFLFWGFFFTLTVFVYLRAKDYYAIGLYPIYISFGAVYLADFLKKSWGKYLMPAILVLPLLYFVLIFNIAFPNKTPEYIIEHSALYTRWGMLRWEDGKDHVLPQDYADMLGWEELATKVDSIYVKLPNPRQTLVLCDNYGQAGAINYYTQEDVQAVSFNADYVNWFELDRKYTNLIRVKEYEGSNSEFKKTSPYFDSAFVSGTVANPYAREYGTTFFVFVGAKVDINQKIEEEIGKANAGIE